MQPNGSYTISRHPQSPSSPLHMPVLKTFVMQFSRLQRESCEKRCDFVFLGPLLSTLNRDLLQLILPSIFLTDENHAHILNKTECEVYLGTEDVVDAIKAVLSSAPRVQYIAAPKLDDLFQDTEPIEVEFGRSWDEAKDDPWLVFHSSGTTGELSLPTFPGRIMPV